MNQDALLKWMKISVAERRIETFNKLVAVNAPEVILRAARDQVMKSREELIQCQKTM